MAVEIEEDGWSQFTICCTICNHHEMVDYPVIENAICLGWTLSIRDGVMRQLCPKCGE